MDWSWLGPAIGGATQVAGALIGSNANQNAASTAADANARAAQLNSDALVRAAQIQSDAASHGYDQYKALVDQAMAEATAYNERAQGTYGRMAGESQPAVDYMRSVAFSDPYQLTPQQQTGLADTRRSANANLAASGLRGAGRAGVAVLNKAEGDYRNNAYASNRSRADSAASTMYGANQTAQNNSASTDRATGATRANLLGGQGTAAMNTANSVGQYGANATAQAGQYGANLSRDTGQTAANAGLADANMWGSAIGAIGSLVNNELKGRNVYGSTQQQQV